jgi:NAD(P)-dependent dehydrogenase (short-subunit alcohol dehydrogenase family)
VAVGDSGRLDFGVDSAGISGGDDLQKTADYSTEAFDRVAGFAGYPAAKRGVIGLTRTAALDYGRDGIRVNAIVAGLVNTPLIAEGRSPEVMAARIAAHPLGRIAEPHEMADAVLRLCSNRSSFVTGTALPVDGGYTAR